MNPTTIIHDARHWRTGERIDVALSGERIEQVAPAGTLNVPAFQEFHAHGAVIAPGFVDLHVHLREPGQSGKETVASGTRAAVAGGFTSVATMPNTSPVVDNAAWIEWLHARTEKDGHCRVLPIGAVTVGQKGEQLAEMLAMAKAGAVAFSDDGRPVMSAEIMRRALEYAKPTGRPIVCHEEDLTLRGHGAMNEGPAATRLGIRGIPAAAESIMVRRDCDLAELTGGRVHFAHLSCAGSFDALRDGKRRGLAVTGETCPHYWMLTEDAVGEYDTDAKMNPPLRSERDRRATIAAIVDGTIDCLVTDHAPHMPEEKRQPFDAAPFGIVGLETAFALTVTGLVAPGHVALARAIELWTDAPRRLFGLSAVALEAGATADLALLDPDAEWTVDPAKFHSQGRSTPFAGWKLKGRVLATWVGGTIAHLEPEREAALRAPSAPAAAGAAR